MKPFSLSSGGVCGAVWPTEGLYVSQLVVINSDGLRTGCSRGRWLDHRGLPCTEMRTILLTASLACFPIQSSCSHLSPLCLNPLLPRRHPCPRTAPLQSFSPALTVFLLCSQTQRQKKQEFNVLP